MINISSADREAIINNLVSNDIVISFPLNTEISDITGANIVSESMTIKQSICDSDTLTFGGCIATEFDISVLNTEDRIFSNLTGKIINVKLIQTYISDVALTPSNNHTISEVLVPGNLIKAKTWNLFKGTIDSMPIEQSNKNVRNIVAYDAMADLHDIDKTQLFLTNIKKTDPQCTLNSLFDELTKKVEKNNKDLNISFNAVDFLKNTYGGSTTAGSFPPKNTDFYIDDSQLSMGQFLFDLAQIIAAFGYIDPQTSNYGGEFRFRALSSAEEEYNFYISFNCEEFEVSGITAFLVKIQSSQDNTDKLLTIPIIDYEEDPVKAVNISDNVFAWVTKAEASQGHRFYDFLTKSGLPSGERMHHAPYTPLSAELPYRPWVECGDIIKIKVFDTDIYGDYILDEEGNPTYHYVSSFVLSRTITGISSMKDTIEAKGVL